MARKPRVEYHGAFYGAIVRANQQQRIFKMTGTASPTANVWNFIASVMDFALFAYVLRSNPVHLLTETQSVPLSEMMQGSSSALKKR